MKTLAYRARAPGSRTSRGVMTQHGKKKTKKNSSDIKTKAPFRKRLSRAWKAELPGLPNTKAPRHLYSSLSLLSIICPSGPKTKTESPLGTGAHPQHQSPPPKMNEYVWEKRKRKKTHLPHSHLRRAPPARTPGGENFSHHSQRASLSLHTPIVGVLTFFSCIIPLITPNPRKPDHARTATFYRHHTPSPSTTCTKKHTS